MIHPDDYVLNTVLIANFRVVSVDGDQITCNDFKSDYNEVFSASELRVIPRKPLPKDLYTQIVNREINTGWPLTNEQLTRIMNGERL